MNKTKARILLISVFIARGTSFLFSKILLNTMSPLSILAVRFTMAFLILAVVFYKKMLKLSLNSFRGGAILGILYTICMFFEMYALRLIDTGVCSLIENMAIVLVPVFAAVLARSLPRAWTMLCAVLAVIGVGFLSLTQRTSTGGSFGIILAILAMITYALCIMTTETASRDGEPVSVGIIQLGTMGVISMIASLFTESWQVPHTVLEWSMMFLLVLYCSCFGFAFQPLGQKYLPAEEAAVLTVMNPLTASVMGILIAGEGMSVFKLVGYVLILLALFLYNSKG
ncbi:MAG: DMT family transporter [Eubacterium sp.]|nr:DMT family transporter [Eubacterium sp.]